MSFEMLNDNVLISSQQEGKRSSPIIIPESATKEGSSVGVVEAVGPGVRDPSTGNMNPMKVKKGDVVYYRKWAGSDIKMDDNVEYKVLQEKDIFAIFVDEK